MGRLAKFSKALSPVGGPMNPDVYVNSAYVRVVMADPDGSGCTLIQLEGQDILVKEDLATVVRAVS